MVPWQNTKMTRTLTERASWLKLLWITIFPNYDEPTDLGPALPTTPARQTAAKHADKNTRKGATPQTQRKEQRQNKPRREKGNTGTTSIAVNSSLADNNPYTLSSSTCCA